MRPKRCSFKIIAFAGELLPMACLIRCIRRFEITQLAIALIAFGPVLMVQAELRGGVSGNTGQPGIPTCFFNCPPGPNPEDFTCDRSTNAACAESAGWIAGWGYVLGRACSDYGSLLARVMVHPTNNMSMDFGASAIFDDAVTLQGGNGAALVRVTFRTAGARSGNTQASATYHLAGVEQTVLDLPASEIRILQAQVLIGTTFTLSARIDMKAPAGGSCPGIADGDADYYSGNNGLRITAFEIFDTNTNALPNVTATGSSGTRYDGWTSEACPVITRQPQSQIVCVGNAAAFSASVSSNSSLNFQWFHDGVPITGATSAVLNLSPVSISDAGTYAVQISALHCAVLTAAAVLTVQEQVPIILSQPEPVAFCSEAPVTLLVLAAGSAPLTYQWRRDAIPIPGANSSIISGPPAIITPGTYDVIVANACGSVTSAPAAVTALTIRRTSDERAIIEWGYSTDVLQSSTNLIGWSDVAGATSPHAATSLLASAQFFRVRCGDRSPAILDPPDSAIVNAGENFTFNVAVAGPAPLSFQWLFNGTNLLGATNRNLTLTSVSNASVGVYELRVSNYFGSITSAPAYFALSNNTGGLAFNVALAQPLVSLLLIGSDNTSGLLLNTIIAKPPIQTLLIGFDNRAGLSANTTVAQPHVTLLLVGTNNADGRPLNASVAQPPVQVQFAPP